MKNRQSVTFLFLILVTKLLLPSTGFSQEKIRIGVPLFPTVSYPVFIAQEKASLKRTV